jgi:hypothetical protein
MQNMRLAIRVSPAHAGVSQFVSGIVWRVPSFPAHAGVFCGKYQAMDAPIHFPMRAWGVPVAPHIDSVDQSSSPRRRGCSDAADIA